MILVVSCFDFKHLLMEELKYTTYNSNLNVYSMGSFISLILYNIKAIFYKLVLEICTLLINRFTLAYIKYYILVIGCRTLHTSFSYIQIYKFIYTIQINNTTNKYICSITYPVSGLWQCHYGLHT